MINILYIHGFNSSPKSEKAKIAKAFFNEQYPDIHFHCPQLSGSPEQAIAQLQAIIASDSEGTWYLMGTSLGGFFATYLAETYHLKAALINPAVKPYELLADYIGPLKNPYTGEVFEIKAHYVDQLKALEQSKITSAHYLVLLQTGDEVLDYQQAVKKYGQSQLNVQQGGDHSFVNFEQVLPEITAFFNINSKQ